MNDPIMAPAHYTVYPVQPIEITRYLGFCLGNATKYVLRAPYKGSVEDCQKAMRYLELEKETPQPWLSVPYYLKFSHAIKRLTEFFYTSKGDALWDDIAIQSACFIENLLFYISLPYNELMENRGPCYKNMHFSTLELKRILALRDTTGQIYDGMTGLPVRGGANE